MARLSTTSGAVHVEEEFLRVAARACLNAQELDRLQALLATDLDWDRLLTTAQQHLLLPLLYWNLSRNFADRLPAAVSERLARAFQINLQRSLRLTAELLEILTLLADHQIAALAYKGPALAASSYPNLGLREFGDLDLLLRKTDLARARELLLARGYHPEFSLSSDEEAAYLASQCEFNLRSGDGEFLVELHWGIMSRIFPISLDMESWWQRSVLVELSGRPVAVPAAEDLLLALCIHGGKHLWAWLRLVSDVAALLRANPTLDWARVQHQAYQAGAERTLLVGLCLARDLMDTPLPESIARELAADGTARKLAGQAIGFMFRNGGQPPLVAAHVWCLRSWRGLRPSLRYLAARILTPTPADWSWVRLPRALFFLYPGVRVLRLVSLTLRASWVGFVEAAHRFRHPHSEPVEGGKA